jgi:cysteinyl-tRNA synthetase
MDGVLALGLGALIDSINKPAVQSEENDALAAEIQALIDRRAAAKQAKDWASADRLRAGLKERGIVLEDSPSGTTWRRA